VSEGIQNLKFDLDDCIILMPYDAGAPGGPRPWRHYDIQRDELSGRTDTKRVTVTHGPTGISYTEDRFLPYRNKQIAIAMVKAAVEELIKQLKESEV